MERPRRLTCRECIDFIDDYLDDELGAEERSVFDQHMKMCPECMDYLRSYENTIRATRCLCEGTEKIPEEVPEGLVQAILAARRRHCDESQD